MKNLFEKKLEAIFIQQNGRLITGFEYFVIIPYGDENFIWLEFFIIQNGWIFYLMRLMADCHRILLLGYMLLLEIFDCVFAISGTNWNSYIK